MDREKRNEVVDIDSSEYADDIEEIVISDYSDEEQLSNPPGSSCSGLKISLIETCNNLGKMTSPVIANASDNIGVLDFDPKAKIKMLGGNEMNVSSGNSSYDSFTEEDVDAVSVSKSLAAKKNKMMVHELYQNLWKAVTGGSSTLPPPRSEIISTSTKMIHKLTVKGRKLEYSSELFLQTNYRLKRKVKRLRRRQKKLCDESRVSSGPGKVVSSRASI